MPTAIIQMSRLSRSNRYIKYWEQGLIYCDAMKVSRMIDAVVVWNWKLDIEGRDDEGRIRNAIREKDGF